MQIYELSIAVILKQDIHFKNMNESLSQVINRAFRANESYGDFHKSNQFKFYSFSGLTPISPEGYKKGQMYLFHFKTPDRIFAMRMKEFIKKAENTWFSVSHIGIEAFSPGEIKSLTTLTPCISTIEKRKHWTNNDYDMDLITQRMISNSNKKYSQWYQEESVSAHNFISSVKQMNEKVIVLDYKNGKLLTNKFQITINPDPLSQDIAALLLGTGLLEKNALGLGYLIESKE